MLINLLMLLRRSRKIKSGQRRKNGKREIEQERRGLWISWFKGPTG